MFKGFTSFGRCGCDSGIRHNRGVATYAISGASKTVKQLSSKRADGNTYSHSRSLVSSHGYGKLHSPVRISKRCISSSGTRWSSRGDSRNAVMQVFDRKLKAQQRDGAAGAEDTSKYDYLRDHIARNLVDRIEDVTRDFPTALDLGCHTGHIYRLLAEKEGLRGGGGIGGVRELVQCDTSEQALIVARRKERSLPSEMRDRIKAHYIQADEEYLPFAPNKFDLVLSNLALHWVNDLPGTLDQIRRLLKPDGVFIGSMLGGSTLTELRKCLLLAEQERAGGMGTHTSPAADVGDCGNLLGRAGFALPTVDTDTFEVEYPNAIALMEDLQGMGESHAPLGPASRGSRDTFLAAAALYQHRYGTEENTVLASFQVVYMIGWSPHESQQQPKRRGTAQHSLKEIGTKKS